jgi:MFS family permease
MFSRLFVRKGLWRNHNFLKLWSGSTISLFGSQVTFLALPFTAALLLHANAIQMGILSAANTVPFLLVSLFAGVWIDRMRRRPLLILADVGRALLLSSVPLVAYLGMLHIIYLYVVAFLVGLLNVFFDVAYGAFLPSLLERNELVEANSKLQISTSFAEFAGPSVAGVLVQLLTAPLALLVDALSFLVSALLLVSLRTKESVRETKLTAGSFWNELIVGLRFTFGHPLLRSLACSSGTLNFTGGVFDAILVLYITQVLHLGAIYFGVMYTVGSLSGIGAALVSPRMVQHIGTSRVTIISALLIAIGWLLIPLAHGFVPFVLVLLLPGMLLAGAGNTLYNITAQTLVQTTTPESLLGRVISSQTCIGLGTLPLGALLGGILANLFGIRMVLLGACLVRFGLLALFLLPLYL